MEVCILRISKGLEIIDCCETFSKLTGYTKDKVCKKDISLIYSPYSYQLLKGAIENDDNIDDMEIEVITNANTKIRMSLNMLRSNHIITIVHSTEPLINGHRLDDVEIYNELLNFIQNYTFISLMDSDKLHNARKIILEKMIELGKFKYGYITIIEDGIEQMIEISNMMINSIKGVKNLYRQVVECEYHKKVIDTNNMLYQRSKGDSYFSKISKEKVNDILYYPLVNDTKKYGTVVLVNKIGTISESTIFVIEYLAAMYINLLITRENIDSIITVRATDIIKDSYNNTLEKIYESLLSPVVVADSLLNITYVNSATESTFGYSKAELYGQNVKKLMNDDTAKVHDTYVKNYLTGNKPKVIGTQGRRVIGKHKDGTLIDLVLTISDTKQHNHRVFTATFQDISNLIHLVEEQKRNYDIVFNTIMTPIIAADVKLTIQFVNNATIKVFGYSKDELIGNNVKILMQDEVAKKHDSYLYNYLSGGQPKIIGSNGRQVKGRTKDGKIIDLFLSISETKQHNERIFTAAFLDISELTHYNEEKIKLIESISETKANFIANMSHEVRTPMNGIIGMLSLLKTTEMTEYQQDLLRTCYVSCENLMTILDDILLFSKSESMKIVLEEIPFNLNDLIEDILSLLSANITNDKELELNYIIDPKVSHNLIGDPNRLRQILLNLINNSIKFTSIGEISVEVNLVAQEEGSDLLKLEFSVIDTGCGIAEEQISKLFKPFTQGNSSTNRLHGGTGLGLAICKNLVELYNGTIDVTSREGNGSTFKFTVELKKNNNEVYNYPDVMKDDIIKNILKKTNLMIVDDNATNCKALSLFLEPFKLKKVTILRSPVECLQLLKLAYINGEKYDVLLTDYHMPIMDGTQLCNNLDKEGIEINKIILSSASSFDNVRDKCKTIKYSITKPIRKQQLLYTIVDAITNKNVIPSIKNKKNIIKEKSDRFSILIIEDNYINRKFITEIIKDDNIDVDEAENGIGGIEKFNSKVYDLIITDIHMPLLNGIETMKIIRQTDKDIAIIVITADITDTIKSKSKMYCDYFLCKPVAKDDVCDIVNMIKKSKKKDIPEVNIKVLSETPVHEKHDLITTQDQNSKDKENVNSKYILDKLSQSKLLPNDVLEKTTETNSDNYSSSDIDLKITKSLDIDICDINQKHIYRILLVDDNTISNIILTKVLNNLVSEETIIDSATTYQQVKEMVSANKYDICFTDLNMPIKNGYDIANIIKNSSKDTIVILLTGVVMTKKEAIKECIDDFLIKPYTNDDLIKIFKKFNMKIYKHMKYKDEIDDYSKVDESMVEFTKNIRGEILKILYEDIEKFKELRDKNGYENIGKLAHFHKSAAGQAELKILHDILKRLETHAIQKNEETWIDMIDLFDYLLD